MTTSARPDFVTVGVEQIQVTPARCRRCRGLGASYHDHTANNDVHVFEPMGPIEQAVDVLLREAGETQIVVLQAIRLLAREVDQA